MSWIYNFVTKRWTFHGILLTKDKITVFQNQPAYTFMTYIMELLGQLYVL